MGIRRQLAYPPYFYTVGITLSHKDEEFVVRKSYEMCIRDRYKGEVLFESKLEPKDYLQIADTTLSLPTCEGILLSGRRGAYAPNDADPAYLKAMERYYENVIATDLEAVTDDIFKVTAKFRCV